MKKKMKRHKTVTLNQRHKQQNNNKAPQLANFLHTNTDQFLLDPSSNSAYSAWFGTIPIEKKKTALN